MTRKFTVKHALESLVHAFFLALD